MISAGTSDQTTDIDKDLGMSVFTHFLAKGLSGEADYTEDDVVTVTELFIYVRYEVANHMYRKHGLAQTPDWGRISGSGEMIFDLARPRE